IRFLFHRALPRRLRGRRGLVGGLQDDQTRRKHTTTVLVEVDHGVMLVDFDERAGPVVGLHDPIAFRPSFHRCPMAPSGAETLPARLAASAAATAAVAVSAAAAESAFGLGPRFVDRQAPTAHLVLIEFSG